MVDFKKLLEEMNSPECQQREKECEEQERLQEELRKRTACFVLLVIDHKHHVCLVLI